jgi:hypothetical protein
VSSRVVVVVAETASLGRSIVDLLLAEKVECRLVSDLDAREIASWTPGQEPVLLVACNEAYCRTAHRWARGELSDSRLVVVGARDPELRDIRGARILPLPLPRERLLALLRDLMPAPMRGPG